MDQVAGGSVNHNARAIVPRNEVERGQVCAADLVPGGRAHDLNSHGISQCSGPAQICPDKVPLHDVPSGAFEPDSCARKAVNRQATHRAGAALDSEPGRGSRELSAIQFHKGNTRITRLRRSINRHGMFEGLERRHWVNGIGSRAGNVKHNTVSGIGVDNCLTQRTGARVVGVGYGVDCGRSRHRNQSQQQSYCSRRVFRSRYH